MMNLDFKDFNFPYMNFVWYLVAEPTPLKPPTHSNPLDNKAPEYLHTTNGEELRD